MTTHAEALAKTLALDPVGEVIKIMERKPPTRGDRQRQIEDLLAGFGMDAMEANEILSAFKVGLRCRYDEDEIPEVFEAIKELSESLDEVERTRMCNEELNYQGRDDE